MNEPIEKYLKHLFKGHELPFDAAAWDKLSQRLDVEMPSVKNKFNWKWYLGGFAILTTSVLIWQNSDTHSGKPQLELSSSNNQLTTVQPIIQNTRIETPSDTKNTNTRAYKKGAIKSSPKQDMITKDDVRHIQLTKVESNQDIHSQIENVENASTQANSSFDMIPGKVITSRDVVIFPKVEDVCEGSVITIQNTNQKTDIYLTDNVKVYTILPGKSINFAAENPGNCYFGSIENARIQYSQTPNFKVKEGIKPGLTIQDEFKYEDGIPTMFFSANAESGVNCIWKIQGVTKDLYGKDVKAHFYKKGKYEIQLTAMPKDLSCPTNIKKQLFVEDDYNLLAVNSFSPNSPNPKNTTFMPYALKERNVDFTLTIIDPSNGATVFQTSDATNGWTGINRSTGQMADANKAFIWVVRIKNPLPDEKSEYKGTVVVLP
jgi:hypothetical protein